MRIDTAKNLFRCSFILLLLCTFVEAAPKGERGEFRKRGRQREDANHTFLVDGIESGFIFLDGQVLDAPYQIGWDGEAFTINEQTVELKSPEGIRRIGTHLEKDFLLLFHEGDVSFLQSTTDEGMSLLQLISRPGESLDDLDEVMQRLNGVEGKERLREQLRTLQASSTTRERAADRLSSIVQVEDFNNISIQAVSRIDQFSYPLTMIGMVLTVIAFGHLLSYRPDQYGASATLDPNPDALKMVTRSIVFVVLLSGLDLIWTILASQAGQMKELNPLASQMIDNPQQLLAFKATATSWWMCLVCTLLAFRWLTFNSMMIG